MSSSAKMNISSDQTSSNFVNVVFRLYHLPDYALKTLKDKTGQRSAVHIALLGSIPELGDLELGNQLIAKPSASEPNVWEVTVDLPACVTFDLSWLVADGDKKILFWDPSDDHRVRLSHHNTVVQVSWSRDPTYSISRTCTLVLQTHYYCDQGQALALIGSAPCLGAWSPKHSVMATEFPRGSGNWQALTQVAINTEYYWKWVVVDASTRKFQRWEECENRFVSTNCERLVIKAPWNAPSSIQSHSQKIYQQTIDMNKVSKFYDAVENCDSLITKEMKHVTSTWNKRRETGEKPFAVTEVEKAAEKEAKEKYEQMLKSRRSFVRKIGRVISPVANFLHDCYQWLE